MRRITAGIIFALLATGATAAAENAIPLEARTGLALTLYADGFGLIKDRRTVSVAQGANSLAFEGVSAKMVPSSALVRAGSGLRVLEQNFEFDLISPKALLRRSVGKTVRIIRTHPTTGENLVETAQILATEQGTVLQIGDRIETGVPGRMVFDSVPQGLRAQPTLLLETDSDTAQTREIELSYLTEGLGWRAEYAAELDADGKNLDLSVWASLSNNTGAAFTDAEVQLVSGDVQRQRETRQLAFKGARAMMAEAAPAPMAQEALGDLHIYSLPRAVTLKNRQSKQVAMLSAARVPVSRAYSRERWVPERGPQIKPATPTIFRPRVLLKIDNTKENSLGASLPTGLVRVYERDSKGRIQFAGEQSIGHVAVDEKMILELGEAVDVGVIYEQTAFSTADLPKRTFEAAFAIKLTNAKAEPVIVRLAEKFPGSAKIIAESVPHDEFTGTAAVWAVSVPANGETKLTYRVRVSRPR
ncbi:MAG: DUF4139 domain-containing protein [Rhodospirillales bacterium]|nr:DUF4139 domain-containing protein [Rhodospirillales bacterium]